VVTQLRAIHEIGHEIVEVGFEQAIDERRQQVIPPFALVKSEPVARPPSAVSLSPPSPVA
jgi:hypothetical protein